MGNNANVVTPEDWKRLDPAGKVQHSIFRTMIRRPVLGMLLGSYRHQMADETPVKLSEKVTIRLTQVPTACTDGETIWYNPTFVNGCSRDSLCFLILHEVLHNALGHHYRRDGRKPDKWNIAIDGAINQILLGEFFGSTNRQSAIDKHFPAPDSLRGGIDYEGLVKNRKCDPAKIKDASSEVIYLELPDDPDEKGNGEGEGRLEIDADGNVTIDGKPVEGDIVGHIVSERMSGNKAEKQGKSKQEACTGQLRKLQQVFQAARNIGDIPESLMNMVTELLEPQVDYRAVLRDFLSKDSRGDFSYATVSRRQAAMPDWCLLAGVGRTPGSGKFIVGFDTSGSIYGCPKLIDEIMSEIYGIQRDTESELTLIYCDCEIAKDSEGNDAVYHFNSDENVRDVCDDRVVPKGGGGTSFIPVFEWAEKYAPDADAIIYFTDLMGAFPERTPNIPTLWIAFEDGTAPFGKTINIKRQLLGDEYN